MSKATIFMIMFLASIAWAIIERLFLVDSIFDQVTISLFCFIGVCLSNVKKEIN